MADLITILRGQYDADIAEAREAGAAEVRARVEAVVATPDGTREWHNQGRWGDVPVVDVPRIHAALNGGE